MGGGAPGRHHRRRPAPQCVEALNHPTAETSVYSSWRTCLRKAATPGPALGCGSLERSNYEPLTLLSYVAAITQRVGLGTSVLILPYHNPIRLAKTAATLDVISGGRVILGVGGIAQESDAMGSPYAERGAITDEAIAIMKELWTGAPSARPCGSGPPGPAAGQARCRPLPSGPPRRWEGGLSHPSG